MDFDVAWCPACDRQIVPKRYTITVPVQQQQLPPPPPSSPRRTKGKTGGLVNGTGRLRHNGTVKAPAPPVLTKQRTVIDQGPIPLYCSDECQFADLNTHRRQAPLDPAQEEPRPDAPINASKKASFSSSSETDSDRSSASQSPPTAMSSLDKLIAMYNFPPLPPPPPTFDEPAPEPAPEYNSGIMMAGRLITSLCPPPAKPQVGKYRPAQEPRKPIPGWTDGSNAWRSTVYSFTAPKSPTDPFHRDTSLKASGSFSASSHRHSSRKAYASTSELSSAPAAAMRSASDEMINKFSQSFIRRSESRMSLYNAHVPATPASPSSVHSLPLSPKRERSLVHPGAQGKLLVPDVKLKVHSEYNGSSGSLSSGWSGPTSASSRRSVRSPLSVTSDSDDDTERCDSALSRPKCPIVENTRSWSYDNVKTYEIMPIPPKKVKKMEKQVVNGQEKEVEVEVEVFEERKRLFLFAPSRISP
ncbi:hypothetical protein GALMADRAFT_134348 [Galerina marginata CBS 339.88]|uniref:Uncharacterized protein n=1 Tax=Galerina marginata (strain CBS 339.88) TaxID=685588 RepID=A0A067TUX0_GALM3|nr:hypothetical protein GALMADRAFT_134348 [Galerina marginata CBS 339.88]